MNITRLAAIRRPGQAAASAAAPAAAIAGLAMAVAIGPAGGWARPESSGNLEETMHPTTTRADTTPRLQSERAGHGPPLVLIGGGLTGWASWQPHAERLAASREVIRLQLLSVQYGLEDRPLPAAYSVRMESRALATALDGLGLSEPIDLAAWSYGALITLDFALEHPERVRTLTLIEPPALWTLPERGRSFPDVEEMAGLLPLVEGDDVSTDALVTFLRTVALVPPGAEPQALPQWESWVRHRRSLRNGPASFDHTDDPARLRAFPRPVLLVTGHGTSHFLRAVHDTLAAALPDARTLELPGGHAPHLAAMDRFLEALARFQAGADERAGTGAGDAAVPVPPGAAAGMAPMERSVRSRDGTRIAYWRSGRGPALLLVHGATADHTTTWRAVRAELERHFTVFAMDRRGRGGSGDGPDYALVREAEDVAAVVEAIGEPMAVLGHSFGALAAIEAALLTSNLHRLILYEGVPLDGTVMQPPGAADKLAALLEAGDVEGVLLTLFRDLVGLPPEEIELIRAQGDAWARRLANAPTLPRELAAERDYVFVPERFAEMRASTLLLVGGDSPPREHANARGVAAALPDGRVGVMPGQQHAAMYSDPDGFVAEVVRFLEATP
jgi:pimeloyl-ACP methyl ester carboxylesterase